MADHVGKESFINALNDGPLQMEVMKGQPTTLEAALNCAIKYEAYEHSLITHVDDVDVEDVLVQAKSLYASFSNTINNNML